MKSLITTGFQFFQNNNSICQWLLKSLPEIITRSFSVNLVTELRGASVLGKHSDCFIIIRWPITSFVYQLYCKNGN